MLREEARLIRPIDLKEQIPFDDYEAIVVIGLRPIGKANRIHMSTMTIDELCFLSKQLDAHVNCLLGMMEEK